MHELGYSDKVRSKGKKREGRQRDDKERITFCQYIAQLSFWYIHVWIILNYSIFTYIYINYTCILYILYPHACSMYNKNSSTVLQKTVLLNWKPLETRVNDMENPHWQLGSLFWLLHPGSACEGRTLLLCVVGWSDSYGRWWRSVCTQKLDIIWLSLVEVGDGGILFFIIMLGVAGLPIQRRGSHWGILGTRKTWRVEKGSSLIPVQKTHIQHVGPTGGVCPEF